MSTLGSVSGHLDRERQLLRELNNALIALQAATLGLTSDFGLSAEDVTESCQLLHEFASRLRSALDEEAAAMELRPLVHRVRSGIKPLEDWREDLDVLVNQLASEDQLEDEALPILEDVLSLLDSEFTEDLRRLYVR